MADAKALRFVGGPLHCYPVPYEVHGMLLVNVTSSDGPGIAPYSLGVYEIEGTGERFVFYGYDFMDIDEMERLILQACRPC